MRLKTILLLTGAFCFMFIGATCVFSQEESAQGQTGQEIKSEPKTQPFLGEVVSVDTQNKMLVLKYLDADTGQEKQINIYVDEKTSYQNVESIDGISPKETLAIDYIVNAEGKNIARVVNLEKQEASTPEATSGNDTGVTQ